MISEKDAAERKEKIKLSAYILFQEKGVDGVSFKNIAAHSGISESSIYHYFPNKSTLMLELHRYLWNEIAAKLRGLTAELLSFQEASGYAQIDLLIHAFGQVHLKNPGYLKFSLESKLYWIRKEYIISRAEYEDILAPVMQQFTDALQKGVHDKSICLHADFNSCSFLMWGILRSYLEQMIVFDALFSDKSNFSQYFETFKSSMLKILRV